MDLEAVEPAPAEGRDQRGVNIHNPSRVAGDEGAAQDLQEPRQDDDVDYNACL